MRVLGIETSCDETAAAVYEVGIGIISSALFSQIPLHQSFGGVVPEIASRSHLEKIGLIVNEALEKASCDLDDIDVIAVTHGPGLPGSLLVGLGFAKAIAWSKNKKLVGVSHLEGHVFSPCIEHDVPFPHVCLAASGGHTSLYYVRALGDYECLGYTIDDAAGEACDKVAKLINVGYPGGPALERLAADVAFKDFFHYPRPKVSGFDFSFSGLKTAVLYDLVKRGAYDMKVKKFLSDDNLMLKHHVASSLLACMSDIFSERVSRALKKCTQAKGLTFVGGVACNAYFREQLGTLCKSHGMSFSVPSPRYCCDNAAMIALVGAYKATQGIFCDMALDIGL